MPLVGFRPARQRVLTAELTHGMWPEALLLTRMPVPGTRVRLPGLLDLGTLFQYQLGSADCRIEQSSRRVGRLIALVKRSREMQSPQSSWQRRPGLLLHVLRHGLSPVEEGLGMPRQQGLDVAGKSRRRSRLEGGILGPVLELIRGHGRPKLRVGIWGRQRVCRRQGGNRTLGRAGGTQSRHGWRRWPQASRHVVGGPLAQGQKSRERSSLLALLFLVRNVLRQGLDARPKLGVIFQGKPCLSRS